MKTSTSYYLRYKKAFDPHFSFIDCKNIKSLEKEIKQMIDTKISFEVWVKFNFNNRPKDLYWYGFDNYASFEIWWYDGDSGGVGTYNLRKNIYYKQLRRYERRLRKLMLTYGYIKQQEIDDGQY